MKYTLTTIDFFFNIFVIFMCFDLIFLCNYFCLKQLACQLFKWFDKGVIQPQALLMCVIGPFNEGWTLKNRILEWYTKLQKMCHHIWQARNINNFENELNWKLMINKIMMNKCEQTMLVLFSLKSWMCSFLY